MRLMGYWGIRQRSRSDPKQQGKKNAGENRNSNIFPFPAVCNPTGKTWCCSEKINGEDLKNGFQHDGVDAKNELQRQEARITCAIKIKAKEVDLKAQAFHTYEMHSRSHYLIRR